MRFITVDLGWEEYDYMLTMATSSFPLWEAHELARKLYSEEKRVRVGKMTYEENLRGFCSIHALRRAGIVLSRGNSGVDKTCFRVRNFAPSIRSLSDTNDDEFPTLEKFEAPGWASHCIKANSGNTAAFDRDAVVSLLNSAEAMSFMSRFKQSGT